MSDLPEGAIVKFQTVMVGSCAGLYADNAVISGIFVDGDVCSPKDLEPKIDIRKQEEGPDSRTVASGSDVPYEIVVENTGGVDLTDVKVTDLLAPGCARVIGPLAAGASQTYSCTAPNVLAGFTNIACVAGEADGVTVTDCDPSTVKIPAIDISKQAEGPDSRIVASGSTVEYQIIVTNTGEVALTGVTVTDLQVPGCAILKPFDLAVGTSHAYPCTASNVTAGFTNEACVAGMGDGVPVSDCDTSTVLIPRIDIRKQAEGPDSRTYPSGSPVPYEIVVTNTGDVDLLDVAVTDEQVPGCARSIGPLAKGANHTYTCTALNVTESFENIACVSGQADGTIVTDCDPSTVVIPPPAAGACMVIIDEEGVDNDFRSVETAGFSFCNVRPDELVNDSNWPTSLQTRFNYSSLLPSNTTCSSRSLDSSDNLPVECGNPHFLWNFLVGDNKCGTSEGAGRLALMPTGQSQDEGWYAPPPPHNVTSSDVTYKVIRYADTRPTTCNRYSTAGLRVSTIDGASKDGYDLWFEEFSAGIVRQECLDKVRDVMPLRNQDLVQLVGKTCTAIVYDSDISMNYKPIYANLQGRRYGKFTFKVEALEVPGSLPESISSTSLYDLWLRILPPQEPTYPWRAKIHDHPADSIQVTQATFNTTTRTLTLRATSNYAGNDTTPPYLQDPSSALNLTPCVATGVAGCSVYNTAVAPTPATDGGDLSYMTVSVDDPADKDLLANPQDPYIREVRVPYVSGKDYRLDLVVPAGVDLRNRRLVIQTDEGGTYNVIIK
jgi:uncharacterized repeat protein (TIGR01451 family)